MISFSSFLISESIQQKENDIIYGGVKKIRFALDSLRNLKSISNNESFKDIINRSDKIFKSMSTRMLQEISTNNVYKSHIKMWTNMHPEKISNTTDFTQKLILFVEQNLNKNIKDAKRHDTRRKREKEKTLVLIWFKNNKEDLKRLFDFKNLIYDARNIIENSSIEK